MENQNELTKNQIIELREKVESYRLASIITAIIIGGLCLIVGIMGIVINMIGAIIAGFIGLVISLIISRVLWNEVRDLDWVLPKQEKEENYEKDRDELDRDQILSEQEKEEKEKEKKKKDSMDFEDFDFKDLDL
jgi:predicted lipid-binding transport protein (Tim44 family)